MEAIAEECAQPTHFEHWPDNFVTMQSLESKSSGDFVTLAMTTSNVNQDLWTRSGDSYIELEGWDMDGKMVPKIKMWRYDESDNIETNRICIIHGLKVKDNWNWGSSRVAECCYRTAIEDATDVPAIARLFSM